MKASIVAVAGIAGSTVIVFWTSILAPQLLLPAAHWFPPADPRLAGLAIQAVSLAAVLFLLRVPVRSLSGGWPPRSGLEAAGWLTVGTFLFSLLASTTMVITGGLHAPSSSTDLLARWAREFPSTGLAGHVAFFAVLVPAFEELLYRALMLGYLMRLLPPWLALAVSTALFAAGHSSWLLSGLSGIAYGLLYLRYRNLWLCVLAHGAHNVLSSSGATLLAAYLHDVQFSMPMNLLLLQISWAVLVLACIAMFLRYVFADPRGAPSVLRGTGATSAHVTAG
jgi:membrane protease YdiL (CAAX protease family)